MTAEQLALLRAADQLCRKNGEADGTAAAHLAGIPLGRAQQLIEELADLGMITAEEYGFSCTVEYTVTALTPQGRAAVKGKNSL